MWSSTIFHRRIDSSIITFEHKMKKKHGENFSKIKQEFMRMCSISPLLGGNLEHVNMSFLITEASRALQQQLTRTRTAGYCIQSLRVVPQDDFASAERFHIPSSLKNPAQYKQYMKRIEKMYVETLRDEAPEDARGLLPLNIESPILMTINMRNFIHMVS